MRTVSSREPMECIRAGQAWVSIAPESKRSFLVGPKAVSILEIDTQVTCTYSVTSRFDHSCSCLVLRVIQNNELKFAHAELSEGFHLGLQKIRAHTRRYDYVSKVCSYVHPSFFRIVRRIRSHSSCLIPMSEET